MVVKMMHSHCHARLSGTDSARAGWLGSVASQPSVASSFPLSHFQPDAPLVPAPRPVGHGSMLAWGASLWGGGEQAQRDESAGLVKLVVSRVAIRSGSGPACGALRPAAALRLIASSHWPSLGKLAATHLAFGDIEVEGSLLVAFQVCISDSVGHAGLGCPGPDPVLVSAWHGTFPSLPHFLPHSLNPALSIPP
eukprot:1373249-Rhodomonas_salina.1